MTRSNADCQNSIAKFCKIDFQGNFMPQGSFFDGRIQQSSLRTSAYSGEVDGIPVILLRPDWPATNLFQGSRIYGGSYNETEAYLYFSR